MKKNVIHESGDIAISILKKNRLKMKLTFLCLLLGLMQLMASNGFSQSAKLTLNLKNTRIEDVLTEIEDQSKLYFIYNRDVVDVNRKVDVSYTDQDVTDILSNLFKGTEVTYEIQYRHIILKSSSVKSNRERPVSGKVTDTSGAPLPGVTVVIKGTTQGTVTGMDGKYSISNIPENATLVFSFVGMKVQEAVVGDRISINITMLVDAVGIEEVVAIGYGVQKKETLTGSISTVKGDDVIKTPTTNASQMITGLLPGITTIQRSGEPGADDAIIRIRGVNTLGNNNPLIVVDGVPGRSLSRIDPSSIESLTVLKDASAAIYGSQAANGVILITTKRGTASKPKLTINLNQGFNQPTVIPEMADGSEYATLLNELDIYDGRTPRYTEEEIKQFTSGTDPWKYPNTDWFKEVLKPWSAQNNLNAQIRGGSEEIKYFLSGGYKFQDAYYHNSVSNYRQYDIRSNIDAKISENIRIGFDIYGRLENRQSPTRGTGPIFRLTTLGNPNIHAKWPDGSPGPDITEGRNPIIISTDASGTDNDKVYTVNSRFTLDMKIPWIEGLGFNASASLDKSFQNRKRWETPWEVNTWDGKSYDENGIPVLNSAMVPFIDARLTQYMYDNQSLLLNAILSYEKNNEKHSFNFMAGVESREGKGNNFNAFRRHYISTVIPELFAGGGQNKDNGGSSFENARLNYFGRINYNYLEKYLLELVWRYDGSYMFPKESRFGFFPGLSIGWRVSEENFWKENLALIEEFKLKASYGQTGNDRIDQWQYISSYGYSGSIYSFGINEEHKMLYEARIPNETVTWEVADQFNVGFESYFLDHKLYFEFDYFNYRRSNILWWRNASVPQSTGFSLPREYIG